MLQILRSQGKATDEVLNQRVETNTDMQVTLFDLCLSRRYKSGLNFLVNFCQISVSPESHSRAVSIIEEGSSVRSIYENGISMADKTSEGSGAPQTMGISSSGDKGVRKISMPRHTINYQNITIQGSPGGHYLPMTEQKKLPHLNKKRHASIGHSTSRNYSSIRTTQNDSVQQYP